MTDEVSLKEFLLSKMEDQRIAVDAAIAAANRATDKRENDVEKWRQNSNEWRAAMDDRERKFVLVDLFNSEIAAIHKQLEIGAIERNQLRGRQQALSMVGGAVGLLAAIVAILAVVLR